MKTKMASVALMSPAFFSGQQDTAHALPPDLGGLFEPKPVTFSFDTPGWYVLAALLLLTGVVLLIKWRQHRIKNAYRRRALKAVKKLETQFVQQPGQNFTVQVMAIVRVAAMDAFGRRQVASLTGDAWLRFLESKGKNTKFTVYDKVIQKAVFQDKPVEKKQTAAIIELSKKWIKTHA